ncbi:MAG: YwqG family protein [Saprospiraceae bacterium]
MIPKFLKEYELALEKYKREAVKIKAKSIGVATLKDKLDLKTSKFLGKPFYPKSKFYPKDKHGNPMLLLAQLNFAEIPQLADFPKDGILQLFLSATDWYDEESKVVYHTKSEMEEDLVSDFSFLSEAAYKEMPIMKVHTLDFEKIIENGGLEDCQFDFQFGDLDWFDFVEELSEKEDKEFNDYFDTYGHKIGGYAQFTQSDPRDYRGSNRSKTDIQLLQIDSEGDIMFGDVGIGHVFINAESLRNNAYEKAYFTWDCC